MGVSELSRFCEDQHLLHIDLFKAWMMYSVHLTKHIISEQAAEKKHHALP